MPKNSRYERDRRHKRDPWRPIVWLMALGLGLWLIASGTRLFVSVRQPVDGYFVLGGSIRREMVVADLVRQDPEIPVLISQGSEALCILAVFRRALAPVDRVWLETCAESTFGNFFYGLPILRRWGVHKVKLLTSATHLPRAGWMAQILLGAHGIWVEVEVVPETGIPGNRESWLKTALDVTRSLVWAVVSQGWQPRCGAVMPLGAVDGLAWRSPEIRCEHQGQVSPEALK